MRPPYDGPRPRVLDLEVEIFECDKCDAWFIHKQGLDSHSGVHNTDRPDAWRYTEYNK